MEKQIFQLFMWRSYVQKTAVHLRVVERILEQNNLICRAVQWQVLESVNIIRMGATDSNHLDPGKIVLCHKICR